MALGTPRAPGPGSELTRAPESPAQAAVPQNPVQTCWLEKGKDGWMDGCLNDGSTHSTFNADKTK